MIAGCVLILAAAVLDAAHWIGRVVHSPTAAVLPAAMYLLAAAVGLLFGAAVAGVGLAPDRFHENPPPGESETRWRWHSTPPGRRCSTASSSPT
jgi:hypothetical protein